MERSPDGQAWQAVAQVAGHGTTTMAHTYTYSEPAPGAAYYRLAQRDDDGAINYSPVRVLPGAGALATLYPNPSAGTFQLTGPAQVVRVRDALGRDVAATRLPDGQVQLAQPQPGLYVVEWLDASAQPQRVKVVVR